MLRTPPKGLEAKRLAIEKEIQFIQEFTRRKSLCAATCLQCPQLNHYFLHGFVTEFPASEQPPGAVEAGEACLLELSTQRLGVVVAVSLAHEDALPCQEVSDILG